MLSVHKALASVISTSEKPKNHCKHTGCQDTVIQVTLTLFSHSTVVYSIDSFILIFSCICIVCAHVYRCVCMYVCVHIVCVFRPEDNLG